MQQPANVNWMYLVNNAIKPMLCLSQTLVSNREIIRKISSWVIKSALIDAKTDVLGQAGCS